MASSYELKKLQARYNQLSMQEKEAYAGRALLSKIMNLHQTLAWEKHRHDLFRYGTAVKHLF